MKIKPITPEEVSKMTPSAREVLGIFADCLDMVSHNNQEAELVLNSFSGSCHEKHYPVRITMKAISDEDFKSLENNKNMVRVGNFPSIDKDKAH